MEEPAKCAVIRGLINAPSQDPLWYKEAAEVSNLTPIALTRKSSILKTCNKEGYGKITYIERTKHNQVTWERPDGGPNFIIDSDAKLSIILTRIMLSAILIKELEIAGFLSFVKVGHPSNWNKCKVFLDGKEMEQVVWACAISGSCIVTRRDQLGRVVAKGDEIDTITLQGHVVIHVSKDQQSFF